MSSMSWSTELGFLVRGRATIAQYELGFLSMKLRRLGFQGRDVRSVYEGTSNWMISWRMERECDIGRLALALKGGMHVQDCRTRSGAGALPLNPVSSDNNNTS
jgi:hypothetical protein